MNNKRLTEYHPCELNFTNCTGAASETHEIFNGSNRQNSMKYGMQVKTCSRCHLHWHNYLPRNAKDLIKAKFQEKFNEDYPDLDFYDIFHKNYL